MLAWHFLSEDKRLGYGDRRLVEVGQTLECEGEPALCYNGMHGSVRLIDALYYARGPIICRVEIEGDIIEGDDKLCGRRRTVLWMLDATRILHEFACSCAEDALALVSEPDARSVAAIAAKRRWLAGEITDEELAAAQAAAWAAAVRAAAVRAATCAAAVAAAACSAAWAAADSADAAAADSAARAAACAVARAAVDAAGAAARNAAWNAEWAAARTKRNARLTEMVMAAHEKEDV